MLFYIICILLLLILFFYYNCVQYKNTIDLVVKTRLKNNKFDMNTLMEEIGYEIIHESNSNYQEIIVIKFKPNKYAYDRCLILNEEMQFCSNDEKMYHEFIVHFPCAYLTQLKNVLIIGGGDLMAVRELCKYKSIEKIDLVDIDKKVTEVTKNFFSDLLPKTMDKRVKIYNQDANYAIHQFPNKNYDLIIIDSTECNNNNLSIDQNYFYKLCKQKLTNRGILVKNGYVINGMPDVERVQKENIYQNFKSLFNNVGVFKIDLPTFEPSNEYKFIICSDYYNIGNQLMNNETIGLSNRLKEYKHYNHYNYISID